MMEYEGAVSWTLAGSGVLTVPSAGHVQTLHLEGHLTVAYHLAWSYGWDTPQIEQLHGQRLEAWSGALALDGASLP